MKSLNKNRILPQIPLKKQQNQPPRSSTQMSQLSQQVSKLHSFLEQSHRTQTQLLREVVNLLGKSVKVQSATYRAEKQIAKGIAQSQDMEARSILPSSRHIDESLISQKKPEQQKQVTQSQKVQTDIINTDEIKDNGIDNGRDNEKNTEKSFQGIQHPSVNNKIILYNDYKETIIQVPIDFLVGIKQLHETQNIQSLYQPIRIFISEILKSLSEAAFYGYYSVKSITQEESKALFSRNLVLNYFQMVNTLRINYPSLWESQSNTIINYFNEELKKAMGYFKLKFPQKKKTYLSPQLSNLIPQFDNTGQFDTYIFQTFRQRTRNQGTGDWNVKKFINFLIQQTKREYATFQTEMKEIFNIQGDDKSQHELHHLIGSKLPMTMTEFTFQQIDQQNIEIRTPQLMRVINKWIQGLESTIKDLEAKPIEYFKKEEKEIAERYSYTSQVISFKQYQLQDAKQTREKVIESFRQFKKQLEQDENTVEESYLNHIQSLIPQTMERYQHSFPAVPCNDLKIGLLTALVSESLSRITERYLFKLLQKFKRFQNQMHVLPFQLYDLYRAKCSGTMKQIKGVYQKLEKKFTIIRVKNRLNTGNRDFLINFTMPGSSLICELQLNVNDTKNSEKQQYYDHFNHFLYQLERAKYGPVCEAISIVSSVEDHFSYFSSKRINEFSNKIQKVKNIPGCNKLRLENNQLIMDGFDIIPSEVDYICNNCFSYINFYTSFLPIAKSNVSTKTIIICGKCLMTMLESQDVSSYLLKPSISDGFELITYKKLLQTKPKYFICVKQSFKKIVYGYKHYKNNIYLKCMFGLDHDKANSDAPLQQVNLKNKQFFNNTFIFTVKQVDKLEYISGKQDLTKLLNSRYEYYQLISVKDPNYYKGFNYHELEGKVAVVMRSASNTMMLLDVQIPNIQQVVLQYEEQKVQIQLAKIFKSTGQSNWDLVGDYTEYIFTHLHTVLFNCKILYCEIPRIFEVPRLNMINLEKCKMKIDKPSIIKFKNFKMPKLVELQFQLTQSKIQIGRPDFPQIKKFVIKAQKVHQLNFSQALWLEIQIIDILSTSLQRLLGFDDRSEFRFKKIKQFSLQTDCPTIDMIRFEANNMKVFKVHNKGVTTYPPSFNVVENLFLSGPKVDFKAIKSGQKQILQLDSVPNTDEIVQLPDPEKLEFVQISKSTAKQFKLNGTYSKLKGIFINNSCLEQFEINTELQELQALVVVSTRIKTLDISKSPNLKRLFINRNNLTSVKMKDVQQIKFIEELYMDYNFYSPTFFNDIQFKDFNGLLFSDYGFEERLGENHKLDAMITKFTPEQFEDFIGLLKKDYPDFPSFTQDDVILQKVDLSFLKEYTIDYQRWKTSADIIQQERKFLKRALKMGFEESECTNCYEKF